MAGFLLYGNFTGAITAMMVLVVDDTELARGYTVNLLLGMDDEGIRGCPFQSSWVILWRMSYFESHFRDFQRKS